MGIHNLFGVCFAVFSISALAADPPVPRSNVSVTVNPTTSYYTTTNSTVRLPSGVSVSPSSASVPVVSRYSGGLQQTIPTSITIDAIKKSAPLPVVVRSTTQTLKGGAKSFFRGGIAGLVLTAGLQQLLDSIDAFVEDGQAVRKKPVEMSNPPSGTYSIGAPIHRVGAAPPNCGLGTCITVQTGIKDSFGRDAYRFCASQSTGNNYPFIGYNSSANKCYYHKDADPVDGFSAEPMSPSVVDDAVDNDYDPQPEDWRLLSPYMMPDDVEITSAPTLQSDPVTTTIYDAAGNPIEVAETNIWYDFAIKDNPSPQPSLDLKPRTETKTFKNGALTGTTTTESTVPAGGGGGGSNVKIDIPTDCEFMPTVCAFLDWFKKDDTPDDPDLSALIDNRDFTETYSVTGGSKQCPADYEFTVDFIGRTYGLSFEPACDFASKMYYFVMAAAYIFAAYITIGASRNG